MFENHFGLRENPFAAGHQSRFVYPSREHQEALAHLRFGIENREPFVLITGEVGTGKTTALYDVLAEYESRAVVALITNSSLTRDELLEEICLRFGLAAAGTLSKPQAIVALERFLRQTRARGHHAILILDEAQNLDRDLLEEIRLLSNLEDQGNKLIQLFLVGQPELEEKLAKTELRQLRQRITVFYRLNPLSPDDTERYIHHRISVAGGHAITIFPADACREVHAMTNGIPREINTVAGQAMLNAFVEDANAVRPEHVRTVERDSEFRSVLRGGAGGARISMVESAPVPAASAPVASASSSPAPSAPGPPPLHPAETHAAAPAASAVPAPTPPPSPAPIAPGPPPLHPAETHASSAAEQAVARSRAPVPISPGPPPLQPAEPYEAKPPANVAPAPAAPEPPPASTPATPPSSASPPAGTPAGPDAPRRPGAVAPAGSAEAWGTWLSSLAQLPSVFDETLADDLSAAAAGTEGTGAQASPPAASTEAPARPESPVRAEAAQAAQAPQAEAPPRAEAVTPASPPPRVESAPRAEAVAPASPPPRTESAPRLEPTPRWEPPAAPAAPKRDETETPVPAGAWPQVAQSIREDAASALRTPRRLEFMEEEPVEEGAKALRWMVVAGVIAVVAIGSVLGIRAWLHTAKNAQSEKTSTTVHAATETPATSPTTTSPVPGAAGVSSGSATVAPPTATTSPTTPTQTSTKPPSSGATASSAPTAKPTTTTVVGETKARPSTTPKQGATAGGAAAGGVAGGAAAGGAAAASGGAAAGSAAAGGASASGDAAGGAAAGGASVNGASSAPPAADAAPAKSSAPPQGLFGIAVGTYLNEERAEEERAKLAASTGLPARVLPVTENDVTEYRLVLGSFGSRNQAEGTASSLIERGLVDEARVVPLSTTTASKP